MRPVFADPRTDYVFKRLFGNEDNKSLLIALLDTLLELDEAHRIVELELLDAAQRPPVAELKHSIVDVKCRDAQGTVYVVEMQMLNVEGFEKRVVFNVAKAYTSQLGVGAPYPALNDVIGVSICDFPLWPEAEVPMLSRWRMHEAHTGAHGLSQLQFVFLELPKYRAAHPPHTMVEKWAYFFCEAASLQIIPEALSQGPHRDALEAARAAGFSADEWEDYIRAGIALQDERGKLSLARAEGRAEGHAEGRAEGHAEGRAEGRRTLLLGQLTHRFGRLPPDIIERIQSANDIELDAWSTTLLSAASLADVFES